MRFEGEAANEIGIVEAVSADRAPALKAGDVIVRVDPRYFRPTEVETLLGDPSKARQRLGWSPEISLDSLIEEMVQHDLDRARQTALLKQFGYGVPVPRED